jgi:hypothetical protein
VLSVGWPLGDIRLLSRPLQNVSTGSLSRYQQLWRIIVGTAGQLLVCLAFSPLFVVFLGSFQCLRLFGYSSYYGTHTQGSKCCRCVVAYIMRLIRIVQVIE